LKTEPNRTKFEKSEPTQSYICIAIDAICLVMYLLCITMIM